MLIYKDWNKLACVYNNNTEVNNLIATVWDERTQEIKDCTLDELQAILSGMLRELE